MKNSIAVLAIAIISVITIAIRFAPFVVFNSKKTPKALSYLSKVLPYSVMGMLVVYCLKDVSFRNFNSFLPELISIVVVALSYVIKRNSLLSIVGGTITYMLLLQFVFVR